MTINQQQQQLNVMHQAAKSISLGGIASGQGAAANLLGGVNPLQLAATVSAINNASNLMGSLARGPGLATQSNRGKGESFMDFFLFIYCSLVYNHCSYPPGLNIECIVVCGGRIGKDY